MAETKRLRRATSRQIHAAAGRSGRCAARPRSVTATRAPWTIQGRLPAILTAAHHSHRAHALADGWICRARRARKRLTDGAHRPPLHSRRACCACKSPRARLPPLLRENAPWGTFALPTGTDGGAQHDSATATARVRPRPSASAAAAVPLSPSDLFLRVLFLRMISVWRQGRPMTMPAGAGHSAFQCSSASITAHLSPAARVAERKAEHSVLRTRTSPPQRLRAAQHFTSLAPTPPRTR